MSKSFEVNKGILKPLEFKGLRAQYIAVAIAGFVAAFLMYMLFSFVSPYFGIGIALVVAIASIGIAFYLNNKYGTNGLSQLMASKNCTKYVNNNKRVNKIIRYDSKI